VDSVALTQWITTLGVGGVLAWMMFQVYRKDVRANSDLWRGQSEALMRVVQENIRAITALAVLVEAFRSELIDAQARRGAVDRRASPRLPMTHAADALPTPQGTIVDRVLRPPEK